MNKVKVRTKLGGSRVVMFLPLLPLATEYFFHKASACNFKSIFMQAYHN